jgi:formylglycine-generating enzyme required for sulfatase activity
MKPHSAVVRCQTPSQPSRGLLSQRFARLLLAGAVLAAPSVAYAQSACDADLDANGEVNGADLTVVLVSWGPCKGCGADIDNDGTVGGSDLASLLILWGETCVQGPIIKSISPNTAPRWGGIDVVITGSNLENSSVMFGTTFGSVRSASDTQIIVTAPPLDPGVTDVIVSKSDGSGSTTVDGAFTVTATLAPDWATVVEELPDPKVVTDPAVLAAIESSGLPWRVLAGNNGLQGEPIPMVLIPSGTFIRGCGQPALNASCPTDAIPALAIDMPAFYIGETEIKQSHFTSRWLPNFSYNQGKTPGATASHPIESVYPWVRSFFFSMVNCRLPTEAEWEYAYRAGTQTAFYTGSDDPTAPPLPGWFCGPCASQPVAQLAPNGFGLYDMAGNVAEEVSDWYQADYYTTSAGNSYDPQGPASGAAKVVRGGSWNTTDLTEASAYMRATTDTTIPGALGFRVAKSVPSDAVLTGVFPKRGLASGGASIKITGQNLTAVTGVYFGGAYPMGNPATILSKKWGEIQVALPPWPAGSDPIDICVTFPGPSGLQIATLSQSFQYANLDWAIILDNQPNPAIVYNSQMRDKIAKSGLPARVRHYYTGMEMLLVPEGTFNMGCSASQDFACSDDELPVHPVTITEPFYLARREWQYQEHPNYQGAVFEGPVFEYSWNELQPILQNYGLRMPTEAEWEYAYRAGTTTAYHAANNGNPDYINGSNLESLKWLIGCFIMNIENPQPCGPRAPNGLGFYDMTGSVGEFVADWYGPYAADAQSDPTGPANGTGRVVRGGHYYDWYGRSRSSSRASWSPSLVSQLGLGVRPAKGWRWDPESLPEPGSSSITATHLQRAGSSELARCAFSEGVVFGRRLPAPPYGFGAVPRDGMNFRIRSPTSMTPATIPAPMIARSTTLTSRASRSSASAVRSSVAHFASASRSPAAAADPASIALVTPATIASRSRPRSANDASRCLARSSASAARSLASMAAARSRSFAPSPPAGDARSAKRISDTRGSSGRAFVHASRRIRRSASVCASISREAIDQRSVRAWCVIRDQDKRVARLHFASQRGGPGGSPLRLSELCSHARLNRPILRP